MISNISEYVKGEDVAITLTPSLAVSSYSNVLFELQQSGVNRDDAPFLCKLSKVAASGYTVAITAGTSTFTVAISAAITTIANTASYDLKLTYIKTGGKKDITIYRNYCKFTEF